MSASVRLSPSTRVADPTTRRTARLAGVSYLITFVSIPTLALYKPIQDHVRSFVLGAGSDKGRAGPTAHCGVGVPDAEAAGSPAQVLVDGRRSRLHAWMAGTAFSPVEGLCSNYQLDRSAHRVCVDIEVVIPDEFAGEGTTAVAA